MLYLELGNKSGSRRVGKIYYIEGLPGAAVLLRNKGLGERNNFEGCIGGCSITATPGFLYYFSKDC